MSALFNHAGFPRATMIANLVAKVLTAEDNDITAKRTAEVLRSTADMLGVSRGGSRNRPKNRVSEWKWRLSPSPLPFRDPTLAPWHFSHLILHITISIFRAIFLQSNTRLATSHAIDNRNYRLKPSLLCATIRVVRRENEALVPECDDLFRSLVPSVIRDIALRAMSTPYVVDGIESATAFILCTIVDRLTCAATPMTQHRSCTLKWQSSVTISWHK